MRIRDDTFEYPAWMPRRPGAAAAALALNAALGIALFLCFRMPGALDTNESEPTLTWLPLPVSPPRPPQARRQKMPGSRASRPRTSLDALSPIVPSTAPVFVTPARPPVDWWTEGERVVREQARATAPAVPDGRIDLHVGSPGSAPAHQAGDSYQDESGDKIVWVSEKCYIESSPPPPGTPPAFAAAGITRTYCPGDSSAPRADLFKDTPAYRKSHPDR